MRGLVLITGGAGFIGSNLAEALSARGGRVVVCDWLEVGEKWRNLVDIDLFDIVAPQSLPLFLDQQRARIEAIIHLWAISATTERDGDRLLENNIRLSIDLWEWCARQGATFIYASSAAVYGDGGGGFQDDDSVEGVAGLRPLNAYGWSKLVADRRFVRDVAEGSPVPRHWAGLRFFNVYGPREEHKGSMRSVISQIVPRVLTGQPVRLFRSYRPAVPDGGQLRDFIYIADCVAAILWLLDHPHVNGIFNLGTGLARSFSDLALAVYSALGREPDMEFVDMPEGIRRTYQYFTQADMTRLRDAGYRSDLTSLENGVARYARYLADRYPGADLTTNAGRAGP